MTEPGFFSASAILCWLMLAIAGSSQAATTFICVEPGGSATYTDAQCQGNSHELKPPSVKAVTIADKAPSQKKMFADAEKARSLAALARAREPKRLSVDADTVRNARRSMISLDAADGMARQQASAEKALQAGKWRFWRS